MMSAGNLSDVDKFPVDFLQQGRIADCGLGIRDNSIGDSRTNGCWITPVPLETPRFGVTLIFRDLRYKVEKDQM